MRTSQRRTNRLKPPTATTCPSGLSATEVSTRSPFPVPANVAIDVPVVVSQTSAPPWSRADAIIAPSALKATSLALPPNPGTSSRSPVAASQNFRPRLLLAVTSVFPSGLKATASTIAGFPASSGPWSRVREPTSQSVRSRWVTAASVRPSVEKASVFTSPPVSRRGTPTGVSSRASQSAMPRSLRPTAIKRPSGLSLPGWPSYPVFENVRSFVNVNGRPSRRSPVRSHAIAVPSWLTV